MAVTEHIRLELPVPCSESWQEMDSVAEGCFCNSCQKTVVDFTAMNDAQLVSYFLSKKENVCGRFLSKQLNRVLVHTPSAPNKSIKQRWLGLITAGLMSWSTAYGEPKLVANKNGFKNETRALTALTDRTSVKNNDETRVCTDTTWVVTGRVTERNGLSPLPSVILLAKGTDKQVTTDVDGLFKIFLVDYQSDKIILKVGAIGYVSQEIQLDLTQKRQVDVILAEDLQMLGEVVVTGGVKYVQKPGFLQKLRNKLRSSH
ncbi:carboxypeptidase-like regulatory domain-containing protein [Spirosoma radiotolerans]|nr:carboxypeptidase-like regulatory domain-containing protein [Spirosoma radiotolerans]